MEQYISKSALLEFISDLTTNLDDTDFDSGYLCAMDTISSMINTLEVKEADLEKEINKYISNNFFGSETVGFFANRTKKEPNDQDIALCAKHFFELGLKAQKGE